MCTIRNILNILSGFLTPTIAILAIWIAYRQYKIQEYRVRFDLYGARITIYESIMKFLSTVRQKGTASDDELFTFLRETSRSKFLFKGEMEKHIDAIYDKAVELQYVQKQLSNEALPVGQDRTNFAKQAREHFKWLGEQHDKTNKMFIKYIKLDK